MKRTKYPDEFEKLWNVFDAAYGEKGSKKRAYEVFKDKEINAEDVDFIIDRYLGQLEIKRNLKLRGDFASPFQHVERYLRNERFDDEISDGYIGKYTASDRTDVQTRAYLQSLGGGVSESVSDAENVLELPARGH